MKIDFNKVDRSIFNVRAGQIGGRTVYLVEPHYSGGSDKWTKETLHYRSSIWDEAGNLISASFGKFFNLFIDEENALRAEHTLVKKPDNLKGWTLVDKKDGSCLIISKWEGNLIVRTRGTFDYSILSNAHEMEILRAKYPKVFSHFDGVETSTYSLLLEWFSPQNRILINYGDEPLLWLIGGVHHEDYTLLRQMTLDILARDMDVPRPERYDLGDLESCRVCVQAMVGKEGVVMYPPGGQNPLKLKSPRYWAASAVKEGVSSIEKVTEIWLGVENPTYQKVYAFIEENYDVEISEYCSHFISKVADTAKKVDDILAGMEAFIVNNKLRDKSDKEAYHIVYESYGKKSNRAGFVMNIRKGKALTVDNLKKLFLQVLKNKI